MATEVIKQLLIKGYDVVGTVRQASGPRLESLEKLGTVLPGSLKLVEADLLVPGSFDDAIEGASYVFHIA